MRSITNSNGSIKKKLMKFRVETKTNKKLQMIRYKRNKMFWWRLNLFAVYTVFSMKYQRQNRKMWHLTQLSNWLEETIPYAKIDH